jgi:hypothetical protein
MNLVVCYEFKSGFADDMAQTPLLKLPFPSTECGVVWRDIVYIIITHINRYCAICRQGLFQAYSGHNLIENKLYSGTSYRSMLLAVLIMPPATITALQQH